MMRLWYISLIQEAFHFVISLKNPVIRLVVSSYLYRYRYRLLRLVSPEDQQSTRNNNNIIYNRLISVPVSSFLLL